MSERTTRAPVASVPRRDANASWGIAVTGVVALLGLANVMSNVVLPSALYVPWNLLVAGALVMIARTQISTDAMGFTAWRRGAAFGLVLLVATAVVLLVAVAMPAFHELYEDRRVSGSLGVLVWQAGIRIPFGTVVLEEVAFRAVAPALFAARWGVIRGCIVASVMFGFWHVLPALSLKEVNPVATDLFGTGAGGTIVAVILAVIGTTVAGFWWCWIRYRAGSVLATVIAHVASNSIGYTIAYFVTTS